MSDTPFVTLTTTYDDPAWIKTFARQIVEERLAACVNILPIGESVYRWEDAIESEPEGVALIHTTRERSADLIARIQRDHTYDEPQILVLDATAPTPGYAAWLTASTLAL